MIYFIKKNYRIEWKLVDNLHSVLLETLGNIKIIPAK